MRLEICAGDKFYYDIGIRKNNNILSKVQDRGGMLIPRYLEDFVEVCGAGNVRVLAYGSLGRERSYIDSILE